MTRFKSFDPHEHASNMHNIIIIGNRYVGKTSLVKELLPHLNCSHAEIINPTEMDKQEYAPESIPSIPHIAHHIEYAEDIVDNFLAMQKTEWKQLEQQNKANCILFENCIYNNRWTKHESIRYLFMNGRFFRAKMVMVIQFPFVVPPYLIMSVDYIFIFREMIESTRKRLYNLYGGIFPTFNLFCEALDEINNVPFACLVINYTSHSADKVMIYIHSSVRYTLRCNLMLSRPPEGDRVVSHCLFGLSCIISHVSVPLFVWIILYNLPCDIWVSAHPTPVPRFVGVCFDNRQFDARVSADPIPVPRFVWIAFDNVPRSR